jgi:hypothetical protein
MGDNIKFYLREVVRGEDEVQLAHGGVQWRSLMITVMNFRVP